MVKLFWWKIGFLGLVIFIQFSFLNTLFPKSAVPGFLFSVLAALALVRGFRTSALEWLALLVFYDILRAGASTGYILVGIVLAYLVSFVSRRFVFEHSGIGLFLIGLLVASVSVIGVLFVLMIQAVGIPGWSSFLVDFGIMVLTFSPIFLLVQWFEGQVQDAKRAQFRGLRHS